MKRTLLAMSAALLVAACSDNGTEAAGGSAEGFDALPTSPAETRVVAGKMTFWMYEGDGGCFGYLANGASELQLWVDVDACGETEYAENQPAEVEVTFNPENQYGPGKTYTITRFIK